MKRFTSALLVFCLAVRLLAQTAAPFAADPTARIAALHAEISHHDNLYYRQAAPEISDFAYDQLKQELADLQRAFPDAAAAVTRATAAKANDDRTGAFVTAVHRERMLGLEKTYAEADFRAWHAKLARAFGRADFACTIEPKLDGIAISVTFEHGKLVRAVTRGNGIEGDDITANVLTVPHLPRELAARTPAGDVNPIPDLIELRGELFLTFAEFARINREREAAGEPLFANPRNAAAGSAKLTDPHEAATRRLSILFYGWGACEPVALRPPSQRAHVARLHAWGLPAFAPDAVVHSVDDAWSVLERFGHARTKVPFPNDGAVVKVDDVALRELIGASDEAPRWALAYKYAPERVETQLRAITVQVGRTGVLTPVAELTPVTISGSTVTRATLHNRAAITRRDLRVGDHVLVEKAGEIIPAIVGVNLARRAADSRPFEFPTMCPACGAAVALLDDEVIVRCPSTTTCPGQLRRRLEHFASKSGVDIEGLGPAMIDALVAHGAVRDVSDLYRLRRDELLATGIDSAAGADRLVAAIARSKRAELWRFIHGFSILNVGDAAARDLARKFGSLQALAHAQPSDFSAIERNIVAAAVLAHFALPRNREIIAELLALGVDPTPPVTAAVNARVAGKVFVLTGRLPHFTRDEATQQIEAVGGIVAGSVSRQTDYVVAGDEPGSKLERARALGITVIDEAALLRMLVPEP